MAERTPRHYRFDGFHVDTLARVLRGGDGAQVALTAKAFDVLRYLLEHRDRLVGKDELLDAIWAGRVVEENSLTRAVSALRHALGVGAGDHRFIVTVPGHGYRFVADVHADDVGPGHIRADAVAADVQHVEATTAAAEAVPTFATAARRWPMLLGAALALALVAVVAWSTREPATPIAAQGYTTLAVLPFRSLSAGARDPMLELGLADTVIARLSQVRSLRVRSLASAERVSAGTPDPLGAAQKLGAAYVVEGATQRNGERVRVTVRLLAAPAGTTVWSGTFDERIDRVFTLQDGIADAVASALALPPQTALARSPCEGADPHAFRAYLAGRYLAQRPTPERITQSIAAFQRAIARDPACEPAYVGIAQMYRGMIITGDRAPREVFPLSEAAADAALRIDPDSAGALAGKVFTQSWFGWDWARAEVSARRAVDANPSLPDAQFAYAHLLVTLGRFDEGLARARQARELDPLSPLVNAVEGGFLGAAGRPQQARARLEHALELEPDFWIALLIRGGMALDRGDAITAVKDLQRAVERSHGNSQAMAMLAIAHVAAGERVHAEEILRALEHRAKTRYVPATALAAVLNALGRTGAALDQLERAYEDRDVRLAFLKVDARWNNLRREPRFRALSARVGLPAGRAAAGRF
jgi:DNA-binding winged helix-turn-helix (wHTH) protein/TolB-like protein/Tfp pilus assembly protein PilF